LAYRLPGHPMRPQAIAIALSCAARAACAQEAAFQLPPVAPAAAPDERPVQADQIRFHGNRAVATADLDAVAPPYRGRMLGAYDLEELRSKLTLAYVQRGYINSGVLLARADHDAHAVDFAIVEGVLTGVSVRGLDGLSQDYVSSVLVHRDDGAFNM